MLNVIMRVFSSPERFLGLFSANDMQETIEEGERIIIDENGIASVNPSNEQVQEDFTRHVKKMSVL